MLQILLLIIHPAYISVLLFQVLLKRTAKILGQCCVPVTEFHSLKTVDAESPAYEEGKIKVFLLVHMTLSNSSGQQSDRE